VKGRVHLLIRGQVQGVFYRATTCERACRLGLTGWVRNLPDGRVEIVAEGEPKDLAGLVTWCAEGPPHARVTGFSEDYSEATGEFSSFRVAF
jgi:acylphosphatase